MVTLHSQSEPKNAAEYASLAGALLEDGDYEGAIAAYEQAIVLKPDQPMFHFKLAQIYFKRGEWDEALAEFQQALALNPDFVPAISRIAEIYAKQQPQLAIAAYERAIALQSDNPQFYTRLAKLYAEVNQTEQSITAYEQAIALKPDLPPDVQRSLNAAIKKRGLEQKTAEWQQETGQQGEAKLYEQIWHAFNQKVETVETWDQSIGVNRKLAEQFFAETSQYRVVDLPMLSEADEQYLQSQGFNVSHLQLNRLGLITQDGVTEDTTAIEFEQKSRRHRNRVTAAIRFQQIMVEEGCVYSICPFTGQVLRSDRSFFSPTQNFFYRFVGTEVFYLIVGDVWLEKAALFFPDRNLIIRLFKTVVDVERCVNYFRAYIVSHWSKCKEYLLNQSQPKKMVILQNSHFAHHLWNQLSAVHHLVEQKTMNQIDQFSVVAAPLGALEDFFPEIPLEKIKPMRLVELEEDIFQDNYFVVSLGNVFIKEDLTRRLCQVADKKSSSTLKQTIAEAQAVCSPLMWISIRTGSRTWVNQTEGFTQIIKQLLQDFPNLGVVFDGFSLPENLAGSEEPLDPQIEAVIRAEQAIVAEIQAGLPTDKIYSTIGEPMHHSIMWAHAVDFYLAHQGSLQHKVGWFANKPGVIHTNQKILKSPLSSRPGTWERENGVLPVYISEEYVMDIESPVSHGQPVHQPMRRNYQCDWEVLHEKVLEMALSLSQH